MAASEPSFVRRKGLFVAGGVIVVVLGLTALGIPQLIYWKIQAGIANSHDQIIKSEAETQSVGGSEGSLSRYEQDQRVQELTKAIAAGLIATCNPDLTPYPVGAPNVVIRGTAVSQIRCAALPGMSTRPAPIP